MENYTVVHVAYRVWSRVKDRRPGDCASRLDWGQTYPDEMTPKPRHEKRPKPHFFAVVAVFLFYLVSWRSLLS